MARTDYFSELEAVGSNSATPSPADSAFHTPRASMSRRSSRRDGSSRAGSSSPPPHSSSSPPPMPNSRMNGNTTDDGNDDISPLDPRRFTPTLHASLVSEILKLRGELDSKHRFIEDLESSLQHARIEKDEVSEKLAQTDKDRRSLKRQFQHLENGTLAALEELAKDRDEAKSSNVDLKTKLDEAQAKLRRKEEESDRTHAAWEKEQNAWETEKRAFERRVHITETRLKAVLAELEAAHNAHAQMQEHQASGEEDDNTKDSGLGDESDTASQASPRRYPSHGRTMSNSSRRSFNRYRFSVQSLAGAEGHKPNGISLADELQLDEENEDEYSVCDTENDYHPEQLAKRVTLLRHSQLYQDEKAKRLPDHRRTLQSPVQFEALEAVEEPSKRTVQYVDTGVQFTPPSSPKLVPSKGLTPLPKYNDVAIQHVQADPVSAPLEIGDIAGIHEQQAKLRSTMVTPPLLIDRGQQMSPIPSPPKKPQTAMVSEGSQTLEEPLSPPATPGVSPPSSPREAAPVQIQREMATVSTQTDFAPEPKTAFGRWTSSSRAPPPLAMPIPSIAIIPPPSAPSSPTQREPKLPPGTKSISTQTTFPRSAVPMLSVSVQTEEIRIDNRRLSKLPPHLHPSAVSSNPATPELIKTRLAQKVKSSVFLDRSVLRSPSPMEDIPSSAPGASSPVKRLPGDTHESGPSSSERPQSSRRHLRSTILAPPFESDLEKDRDDHKSEFSEVEPKVATYSTPSSSGRGMKHLRGFGGTRPSPVPEEKEAEDRHPSPEPLSLQEQEIVSNHSVASQRSSTDTADRGKQRSSTDTADRGKPRASTDTADRGKPRGSMDTADRGKQRSSTDMADRGKPRNSSDTADRGKSSRAMSIKSNNSKSQSMRRSAMIQSGTAAHLQRSRTPSIVSVGSSYLTNQSAGAGPPFPVPDRASSRKLFVSRSEGSQSPTPRAAGLFGTRKKRETPLVRKDSLRKVRSATAIQRPNSKGRNRSRSPPLSPSYPPLPKDTVPAPSKVYASQRSGDKRLSQIITSPSSKPDLSRASQGTVVDAIAATMVGEWMWKYVRRRTSFGVPESPHEQIGRPGTDGSVNVTGNGVRHKRWVWLSPYERAIMWSSKQPASNSALMGKSGRKLVIQSVLDVRDDTPLPKNHGIHEPFNRSILILTPARALKFTATSRERHYTWLTALSFLAHSPLLEPGFAELPQTVPESPLGPPPDIPTRNRAHTLKRGPIRDSVRLAKDRRPTRGPGRAVTPTASIPEIEFQAAFGPSAPPPIPAMPEVPAAEPPSVPRYSHGRKRSLTGPRLPTRRSFGYKEVQSPSFPTSLSSLPSPSVDPSSARTSEVSSPSRNNFLDQVGTIRMEAFIEGQNATFGGSRRRGNTAYSSDHGCDRKRGGMVLQDDFDVNGAFDPFRDFAR